MALPASLRREITIIQPDIDTSGLKKIGEEITEILDLIPGELYVKQYIRPKYVVSVSDTNSTILTASLPERILEKSMFNAAQNDPQRAEEALLRFQKLYEVERVIRE